MRIVSGRIAILLACALVIPACVGQGPAPEPRKTPPSAGDAASSLFPLAVGNVWAYAVMDQSGRPDAEMKIQRTEEVLGTECFVVENWADTGKLLFLTAAKGGIMRHKMGIRFYDPPKPLLRFPPVKGDEWDELNTDGVVTRMRNSGQEDVSVPFGKFRCWRIEVTIGASGNERTLHSMWFAPGVGLVKMVSGKQLHIELKSFTHK
jgi:hypothetical protein